MLKSNTIPGKIEGLDWVWHKVILERLVLRELGKTDESRVRKDQLI